MTSDTRIAGQLQDLAPLAAITGAPHIRFIAVPRLAAAGALPVMDSVPRGPDAARQRGACQQENVGRNRSRARCHASTAPCPV
jgi:hypothetical protein